METVDVDVSAEVNVAKCKLKRLNKREKMLLRPVEIFKFKFDEHKPNLPVCYSTDYAQFGFSSISFYIFYNSFCFSTTSAAVLVNSIRTAFHTWFGGGEFSPAKLTVKLTDRVTLINTAEHIIILW